MVFSGSVSTGVVPLVGLGTFPVGVVVADSVVVVVSPDTGSEAMMVRPSVQRASGRVEDGTGVVVATFVAVARGLVFLVVGVLVAIGVAGVVLVTAVVVGDGEVKISVAIVVTAVVVTGRDVASIVAVTSGVAVTVVGVFVPFVVAGVVTTEVTTVVEASVAAVVTAWVAAAGAVGVGVGSLSSSSHMALPVRPPVLRRNKALW